MAPHRDDGESRPGLRGRRRRDDEHEVRRGHDAERAGGLRVEGLDLASVSHARREVRVLGLGRRVQVFALAEPADMRKSFDTLGALVREQIQRDVLDVALFLFVGKGRRRAKILFWDGTGLCVLAKRREKGRFSGPWAHSKKAPVLGWTTSELALFLEGNELVGRVALSPPAWRPDERRVTFT